MVTRLTVLAALSTALVVPSASADEIHLKNGDRLSGRIMSDGDGRVVLEHEAAGTVTVEQAFVERIVRDDARAIVPTPAVAAAPSALWSRELSLGYNLNRGNTLDEGLTGKVVAHRKTDHDELNLEAQGYYSETDRVMTAQRYGGMARYASSFGPRMAWYRFYKLDADHDRFSNVNWRLTPSAGVGYWLADEEDWKAMAEIGLGWEKTNFGSSTDNRSIAVLVPRAYAYKLLFGKTEVSEDLTIWPSLNDVGEYRLRSETTLANPLTEALSLRVTFLDEFQSDAAAGTRKNDARLTSSLVYTF